MFANFMSLAAAENVIRWIGVEKSPSEGVSHAVVKVEGGKTGDKIYLMENPDVKNQLGWVPKGYYAIPENAPETLRLPLPDCSDSKYFAFALQDQNGKAQQPVYSKPFMVNNNAQEQVWVAVDNGKFIEPSTQPGSSNKPSTSTSTSTAGAKSSSSKKESSSAGGAIFSFAIVSAILLSMMM